MENNKNVNGKTWFWGFNTTLFINSTLSKSIDILLNGTVEDQKIGLSLLLSENLSYEDKHKLFSKYVLSNAPVILYEDIKAILDSFERLK